MELEWNAGYAVSLVQLKAAQVVQQHASTVSLQEVGGFSLKLLRETLSSSRNSTITRGKLAIVEFTAVPVVALLVVFVLLLYFFTKARERRSSGAHSLPTIHRTRSVPGGSAKWNQLQQAAEDKITADIYGVAMFSIINDGNDIFSQEDHDGLKVTTNYIRFSFTMIALVTNYFLQVSVLWYTYYYVAMHSSEKIKNVYGAYKGTCFNSKVFDPVGWAAFTGKEDICNVVMLSSPGFFDVMLVIWCCRMIAELRTNLRLFDSIRSIPEAPAGECAIIKCDDSYAESCTELSARFRWAIVLFVCVPKLLIGLMCFAVGTAMLASTLSYQAVILKSVALEFILHLDEWLYATLVPRTLRMQAESFKISTPIVVKEHDTEEDYFETDLAWMYVRSIISYLLMLIVPVAYIKYGQGLPVIGVLPDYNPAEAPPSELCWDYVRR